MTTSSTIEDIQQLGQQLLTVAHDSPAAKVIVQKLSQILYGLTQISGYEQDEQYNKAVTTATGIAISPNNAVRCFLDVKRTVQFFKAIVKAIQQKLQSSTTPVEVLYAGTGPYAPFFTLVAPLFSPAEVQFSLLEINAFSLEKAKEIVHFFGLEAYVMDYLLEDAIQYKIPADRDYQILFTETLDAVLDRECFVPILLNLLPQLSDDVILIPENVILDVSLVKNEDLPNGTIDFRKAHIHFPEQRIEEIFNLKKVLQKMIAEGGDFPTYLFKLENPTTYDFFTIYTRVQVLDDFHLVRGESLLTEPHIRDVSRFVKGDVLNVTYQLEPTIKLNYFFTESN